MSKIEIRNLYLIFGKEKHKAEKMLKEGKTKEEILKSTYFLITFLKNGRLQFRIQEEDRRRNRAVRRIRF